MPAGQTATSDDADVISQKLAAVCKQNRSDTIEVKERCDSPDPSSTSEKNDFVMK